MHVFLIEQINISKHKSCYLVIRPPIVPGLIVEMPIDMVQATSQMATGSASLAHQRQLEDVQRKKAMASRGQRSAVPDEFPGGKVDTIVGERNVI